MIIADKLSKVYKLYEKKSDRVKEVFSFSMKSYHKEHWALSNVNFTIKQGSTVGIVGSNGSGKSTLLKIISGVQMPTIGSVQVKGRISALLELGAGFNPEMTGYENIFFNGAINGLSKDEIESKVDEILSFADIGDYIHQPVRTYSSGMFVRLAFAQAINIDPEVFLVDEALSVGDVSFQRKCFSKIEQIKNSGTTILFVSHSPGAITELCDEALLLDKGELIHKSTPSKTLSLYHKLSNCDAKSYATYREHIKKESDEIAHDVEAFGKETEDLCQISYEPRGAEIKKVCLFDEEDRTAPILYTNSNYLITFDVFFNENAAQVNFSWMIKTITGVELGGGTFFPLGEGLEVQESQTMRIRFPIMCTLAPHNYFLNVGVLGSKDNNIYYMHRIVDAKILKVESMKHVAFTGMVNFNPHFTKPTIDQISNHDQNQ